MAAAGAGSGAEARFEAETFVSALEYYLVAEARFALWKGDRITHYFALVKTPDGEKIQPRAARWPADKEMRTKDTLFRLYLVCQDGLPTGPYVLRTPSPAGEKSLKLTPSGIFLDGLVTANPSEATQFNLYDLEGPLPFSARINLPNSAYLRTIDDRFLREMDYNAAPICEIRRTLVTPNFVDGLLQCAIFASPSRRG